MFKLSKSEASVLSSGLSGGVVCPTHQRFPSEETNDSTCKPGWVYLDPDDLFLFKDPN